MHDWNVRRLLSHCHPYKQTTTMSSFIQHPLQDSDSDDDDYVPTAEAG